MVSQHLRAILFRRWTLFKRSYKSIIIMSVLALLFTVLAIIANYLMKILLKDKVDPIDFSTFLHKSDQIVVSSAQNYSRSRQFLRIMNETYYQDVGSPVNYTYFDSREDLNEWMFSNAVNLTGPEYITMGVGFKTPDRIMGFIPRPSLIGYYNSSWIGSEEMCTRVNLMRVLWKATYGEDTNFVYSVTRLLKRMKDFMFGQLAPMLITCGLCSIVPVIISQPIIDVNGEVRQYMISCSLKLLPYWVATFIVDIIVWIVLVNAAWLIYLIFGIPAIKDNILNSWYSFMLTGPSFVLFIYCCSFIFSSPESGTRQMFLVLIITLLVPIFVDIILDWDTPFWPNYIYAFFPHIALQRILSEILVRVSILKENLSYYFKEDKTTRLYFIMQYVDIILYILILFIIEKTRIWLHRKLARARYDNYDDFFAKIKAKHPATEETKEMEKMVHDEKQAQNLSVRIINVSRLFFNTSGEPIAAVNNVSLGVRTNSIFGFLGANGAGKTTLIKMITSMLPPSDGKIEINGVDITSKDKDIETISVCPQFNTHLCDELTPREHFYLYGLIHKLDKKDAEKKADEFIERLDLTPHQDKCVRELSGGNQRKLAFALAFYGRSKIILLDEPTSSLDPVARHHVHDMIKTYRGRRTFMLCTHLLNEAESLCDMISIMIKGCVYTCGTPQYLSQKFGTEFKIDVMLHEDNDDCNTKCDNFFSEKLPDAKLSILRPKVRIYAIPANVISLANLFNIMEKGAESDCGFKYYTCSSSSLERVFMEIVHLSENEDAKAVKDVPADNRNSQNPNSVSSTSPKVTPPP